MSFELLDAHVHLTDERIKDSLPEILSTYETLHLKHAVVVGSSPADWRSVIDFSRQDDRFIPAIGLHPWKVNDAPDDWQEQFIKFLSEGVSVIGEIGLDQWINEHEIECQLEAFCWQLEFAAKRNLPTSIHCLKAHDPMLRSLRSTKLPGRGFKLHAYNGPVDTVKPLLELGAYFSFNAGQLKPNAKRIHDIIKLVPDDRLLIETDAPNFLPPPELREYELPAPELCHPGNLRAGYRAIAELRGCSFGRLAETVALNFECYFLSADS